MIKKVKLQSGQHMYLAVGEIGAVANFKVRAVIDPPIDDPCQDCCLYGIVGCERMFGSCMAELRPDSNNVIYKKIENNE